MNTDTCLCIDLRSAAQRLTQLYDQAMSPSGISVNQFSLMHQILTLESPTMKDLASASGLDRSTLGRNLRVLEKQRLVSMSVGDDARTRNIHLTKSGIKAFKTAAPLWQNVQNELIVKLGQERRIQLKEMLAALTT